MPSKPDKYGIKIWALCDAKNGYCMNFEVYTGRAPEADAERNQGTRVVLELTEHVPGGYNITTDNFFTSIDLARKLKERNNPMTLLGTIRRNKPQIPEKFLEVKNRELFSSLFGFSEGMMMTSYIPKPRKTVLVLSSSHYSHIISDEAHKFKPEIILDYNRTKGGVDMLDKVVKIYRVFRKSNRWTFALFLHYIDVILYNAYILWTLKNPDWEVTTKDKRRNFILEVGKALVLPFIRERDKSHLQTSIIQSIKWF